MSQHKDKETLRPWCIV